MLTGFVRRRLHEGDSGMVTAELATGLPVLVFLLLVALAALDLGRERIACADLAASAARQLARGAAVGALPSGAALAVVRTSETVTVTVTMTPAPISLLRSVTVSETAVAAVEAPQP